MRVIRANACSSSLNWFPSPPSPSAKDTGLGKTRGGEAVGTILSWKESSVGSGGGGQKKPPLVLSAPKMSESDANRVEEAVKDFKRVSAYVVRSSLQAAVDLAFIPSLLISTLFFVPRQNHGV